MYLQIVNKFAELGQAGKRDPVTQGVGVCFQIASFTFGFKEGLPPTNFGFAFEVYFLSLI